MTDHVVGRHQRLAFAVAGRVGGRVGEEFDPVVPRRQVEIEVDIYRSGGFDSGRDLREVEQIVRTRVRVPRIRVILGDTVLIQVDAQLGVAVDRVADHRVADAAEADVDAPVAASGDHIPVVKARAADQVAGGVIGDQDPVVGVALDDPGGIDAHPVVPNDVVVAGPRKAVDLQALVLEAVHDETGDGAVAALDDQTGGRSNRQRPVQLDDRITRVSRLAGCVERHGTGDGWVLRGRIQCERQRTRRVPRLGDRDVEIDVVRTGEGLGLLDRRPQGALGVTVDIRATGEADSVSWIGIGGIAGRVDHHRVANHRNRCGELRRRTEGSGPEVLGGGGGEVDPTGAGKRNAERGRHARVADHVVERHERFAFPVTRRDVGGHVGEELDAVVAGGNVEIEVDGDGSGGFGGRRDHREVEQIARRRWV